MAVGLLLAAVELLLAVMRARPDMKQWNYRDDA